MEKIILASDDSETVNISSSFHTRNPTVINSIAEPQRCITIRTLGESLAKSTQEEKNTLLRKNNMSVKFGYVEMRSHEIILGDNPSVSGGPPITIAWEAFRVAACSVDQYEEKRESSIRNYHEMKIPSTLRFEMLSKTTPMSKISQRSRETSLVKKQRAETRSTLYRAQNEEKLERLVRGFRNLVTNKKKKEKKFLALSQSYVQVSL